jgi:hypothetical protein
MSISKSIAEEESLGEFLKCSYRVRKRVVDLLQILIVGVDRMDATGASNVA